ncbi:MAG: DUF4272 domain-containing protein [Thermoleophilia bacterium]
MKHPDENETARRALCLGALVMRGKFESIAASGSPHMATMHEELATQLNIWLADEGLISSQSTLEKPLVSKALGSWSRQENIDVPWRANSLGVILWALSQFEELPPWDTQLTPQETIKPLNLFAPTKTFLGMVSLRPDAEVEKARDLAELWHWRARTRRLQEDGIEPEDGSDLMEIVRSAAAAAHKNGDIPEPVNGDFPAFGKAFAELSQDEYNVATSIAVERHYALNWLCGYSRDWDCVPTDT